MKFDEVVRPEARNIATKIADLCLEYRRVSGRDHGGVVAPDTPLVTWTQDRIDGKPRAAGRQRS